MNLGRDMGRNEANHRGSEILWLRGSMFGAAKERKTYRPVASARQFTTGTRDFYTPDTQQCSWEKWCRRRESEYSCLLKTRKLLIFRNAKNAEHGEIAPSWNVSGTRDFQFSCKFCEVFLERKKISNRANRFEPPNSLCRTPVSVNWELTL